MKQQNFGTYYIYVPRYDRFLSAYHLHSEAASKGTPVCFIIVNKPIFQEPISQIFEVKEKGVTHAPLSDTRPLIFRTTEPIVVPPCMATSDAESELASFFHICLVSGPMAYDTSTASSWSFASSSPSSMMNSGPLATSST